MRYSWKNDKSVYHEFCFFQSGHLCLVNKYKMLNQCRFIAASDLRCVNCHLTLSGDPPPKGAEKTKCYVLCWLLLLLLFVLLFVVLLLPKFVYFFLLLPLF